MDDIQRAIEELQILAEVVESMISYGKNFQADTDTKPFDRKLATYKTAISAMQELQRYRELEEKCTKENSFCLRMLMHKWREFTDDIAELYQYRQIGTLEECREAMEKQKAKEAYYEGDGYADGELVYDTWICPCCGKSFEVDYDDYDYCPQCGQHIDREEEKRE